MKRKNSRLLLLAAWMTACFACGGGDEDLVPPQTPEPAPPSTAAAQPARAPWPKDEYRKVIADGIETLLVTDPVEASQLGDHRFDTLWSDISEAGEKNIVLQLQQRASELRAIAEQVPNEVTGAEIAEIGTDYPALDATVLADRFEARAYEKTTLARLEADPSEVVELIGQGMTSLTSHDYAPMHARYTALATRLETVPDLLKTARGRLKKCTRAGFENLGIVAAGLSRALRSEIAKQDPAQLDNDKALVDKLKEVSGAAAAAIDAYVEDVKKSFPAKTLDSTPIGAEAWATIARLKEGVSESPQEVRQMGESELLRLTRELDDLMDASSRAPHGGGAHSPKDRAAFVHTMASNTLPDDKILAQYRYVNQGVEQWLKSHAFATVPWDRAKLAVVQTPPHQRGISFASMNEAGPLEPTASDAHFEVNIPDPAMSPPQQAALRAFHSLGAIDLVSIHEALPGHYLQGLHQRQSPSKVRKVVWASTMGEGWAHYCEQAVLDAGYTGDDAERTRAFYIRMALQRAARVVIDVGENDGTLSFEDGAKLMEERALLPAEASRIEARRALVHPVNMFTYTYGKLSILRMRKAVEAREQARFDLTAFHDRLLRLGAIPIRYVSKVAFGVD
jgi:uncharacterized protein (DUF885 family)